MVAGPKGGCRPAHGLCIGTAPTMSSDEQSTTSPPHRPSARGGMQAFMDGIISPFMSCWQPPIASCVSPVSSYGGSPAGVAVSPGSPDRQSQQQTTNIRKPHPNDVLCGRGGATNSHIGNLNFRSLVGANKDTYVTLTKKQKMMMARAIVKKVHNQDPPGRFLQKDSETGLWFDIGMPRSLEKTSQALREKTAADKAAAAAAANAVVDDRDGSEAGSRTPDSKARSTPSTPTSSVPSSPMSSPLTTPTRSSSTTSAPEILIPDHLEAQFNPQYARRRLSYPDYPPHPHPTSPPHHPSSRPYLPQFGPRPPPPPPPPPPPRGVDTAYAHASRHGHYPHQGPPSQGPPPQMYPPPYTAYDHREHEAYYRRSQGPPPSRLPPPQPYPPVVVSGPPPPPPPPPPLQNAVHSGPPPPHVVPADYGSPHRRGGAQVSPGRRQEWKRRRTSEDSASRVPDTSCATTSLSRDMQSRLTLDGSRRPGVSSPTQVLQSRSRRGSSDEGGEMSGLAALSSAALLKLDEEK